MRSSKVISAILFMMPCLSVTAHAEDCAPLRRAASIDLVPLPGGRQIVPVTINGQPKRLVLDTGGGLSTLSQSLVSSLGLPTLQSRARLLSSTGNVSERIVHVDFGLGPLITKDLAFVVAPDAQPGANPSLQVDGKLAGDMMQSYDVEMDFGANKLNYFLPDHCEGKVIYWPATAVAVVPFSTIRPGTRQNWGSQIRVPVKLDGKEFLATINTGLETSRMSAKTAQFVFGVTADTQGVVPLGVIDGDPEHKVFGHVFGNLSFEGISVTNPHIAIYPDLFGANDPNNSLRTGSLVRKVDDDIGPEIVIGMDVLKKLHIFYSYHERKLYITPAATLPTAACATGCNATTGSGN